MDMKSVFGVVFALYFGLYATGLGFYGLKTGTALYGYPYNIIFDHKWIPIDKQEDPHSFWLTVILDLVFGFAMLYAAITMIFFGP